jgi:Txe/YoeB family toxin of Txe-Axe toxin-antitoxin module
MEIKPLRADLVRFLTKHNLTKKFHKQARLFNQNPYYPSLRTERLEPKHLKIYSFRIDKKYRAIFIITPNKQAEVIDINLHYQ